jgi:hypothetical protein
MSRRSSDFVRAKMEEQPVKWPTVPLQNHRMFHGEARLGATPRQPSFSPDSYDLVYRAANKPQQREKVRCHTDPANIAEENKATDVFNNVVGRRIA